MTANFLAEVVARVSVDCATDEYARGVPARRARSPPSLREAIERERGTGALVVEYKRASPATPGALPTPRSVDEFVAATDVPGVAAYSCLATTFGFDGAPSRVAELVSRTSRPVLFKEFVLNEAQLDVATRTGAAAVLLIARLATDGLLRTPLAELARGAHRRGLEVVLELHRSAELSGVDGVEADVFGVNTRDLATLTLERRTAYATIERAAREGLRPLLGLSGVDGPAEAAALYGLGCDGILVGSAVARSAEPARLLASLRRPGGGAS